MITSSGKPGSEEEERSGVGLIKSCIFYNFFDQCRAGINSGLWFERCHLSEARNCSIHAVNPKVIKVLNCTVSKPCVTAFKIEWLRNSSNTDKSRTIKLIGNEIYGSGNDSIIISSKNDFSAHNLKILIN